MQGRKLTKHYGKIFVFWLIVFALCGVYVYMRIDARVQLSLVTMCDHKARVLQDLLSSSIYNLGYLTAMISTWKSYKTLSVIDQDVFAEYASRTSSDRPVLKGVAYAQRVMNSEREDFERQHGTIRTMTNQEPSPDSDEYAPVIFTQETISYLHMLDIMTGQEERENILRALSTGKAVVTSPYKLLGSHHLGVVVTIPVYKSKLPPNASVRDRIEATVGYLGGAVEVENMVAGNQEMVVTVYDVTNMSDPLIMYSHQAEYGDMSRVHITTLDFGDPVRKHQMSCRYLHHKAPKTITTAAVLGYVIAFLATYTACIHITNSFNTKQQLNVRTTEAADVTRSQFNVAVLHEIKTQLNGMIGMLGILLDTELSSEQKDYAQTAEACVSSLKRWLEQEEIKSRNSNLRYRV